METSHLLITSAVQVKHAVVLQINIVFNWDYCAIYSLFHCLGQRPLLPWEAAAAALWGGGPVTPSWAAAAREKEKDGSTGAEDAKHLLITSRKEKSSAYYFCCPSQTRYRITEKYRFQLGLTEYLGR